jgi:hypothetical protein
MAANQRIVVAITMLAVSLAAFGVGYLLLQSTALGAAAAVGLVGATVLFVDPFVGLVTYLLFLYLRPQDYVLALQNIPIMLALSVATFVLMILHMAVRYRMVRLPRVPQILMLWFYAAIVVATVAQRRQHDRRDADFCPRCMHHRHYRPIASSSSR